MSRSVLVTGAGSGIGRAVALGFLALGDTVTLAGRRADALKETLDLAGAGARGNCRPTDVSDPASVAALFEAIGAGPGRVDVVFNNAGVFARPTPFEDIPLEIWNAVVAVNLTGAFLVAQHAVRMMKAQDPRGGRIINNGSISAQSPRPDSAPYTTTKHAITGLTRQLALDGRAHDICCGQIDIGNAATAMTAGMTRGVTQADGRTAPEPVMDVRAVVDAVAMMASLPLSANVLSLTVMATAMPFVGRG